MSGVRGMNNQVLVTTRGSMSNLCWLVTGAQGVNMCLTRPDQGSRYGWLREGSMEYFPPRPVHVLFAHHTPGLPALLFTFLDTVQSLGACAGLLCDRRVSMWLLTFCPVQGTAAAAVFPELWNP